MTVTVDPPKSKTVALCAYTHEIPISLKDAIKSYSDLLEGAIGLFYSPQHCCFGKVSDAKQGTVIWYEFQSGKQSSWQQRDMENIPVFEAKIFTEETELRWLNIPNHGGKAVLLREKAIGSPDSPFAENLYPHSQTYLLWGEGLEQEPAIPAKDWSTLATARIGRMAVPIADVKNGQSVLLEYREYLGRASGIAGEQHGNISVVEDRLIGLKLGVENGKK